MKDELLNELAELEELELDERLMAPAVPTTQRSTTLPVAPSSVFSLPVAPSGALVRLSYASLYFCFSPVLHFHLELWKY